MFLGVQQPLGQRLGDHLRQFDGGDGHVEFVLGFHPERSQRGVGTPVVERDERARETDVHQVDRDEQHRGRLGAGDGDVLGHHLAEQHVQRHHDRQRHDERHRVQQRVGDAQQPERLFEQMRDRGLGHPAEQNRTDRDAQLGSGQHQRQVLAGPDDRDGALLALLGQRLEPVAPRGDQRELRADEERVGREQHEGEQDAEDVTHPGSHLPGRVRSTAACRCDGRPS